MKQLSFDSLKRVRLIILLSVFAIVLILFCQLQTPSMNVRFFCVKLIKVCKVSFLNFYRTVSVLIKLANRIKKYYTVHDVEFKSFKTAFISVQPEV